MRPIERIDNFIQKVNWYSLFYDRWKLTQNDVYKIEHEWIFGIIRYWKKNPDMRFGQILINSELVPDNLLIWDDEEHEILASQGYPPEQYLFWTSYLDKDENKLAAPITKLVADLDASHIKAIIKYLCKRNVYLPPRYADAFTNVINSKLVKQQRLPN